jgi:DNA-binding FadR family transcriptional regulator
MSTAKVGAQRETAKSPDGNSPRQVIEAFLEASLSSGRFGPGARLPTERALSEQLKVPRSAVRNAFSRLEALGRVVRITGSGTYVSDIPAKPEEPREKSAASTEASPREIMETRLLVEPRLARLVVAHATQSELDYLQHCVESMEAATGLEGFEAWDTRLHLAIAEATHNRLLVNIYRTITATRSQIEWGELKRKSLTPERRKTYEVQHREIVAALRARDAAKAEAVATEHLQTIHQNLLGRMD